ncbi:PadR family transcriptional regulator PadR [Caulobacter ginsengisoli]|uniref:PadR family transcriptional regulator PadR n=1 Tax=Caulobacter ginsengisoli TaxID=400775 RepID=A0ABU0ILN3_9CAUL|nr:PadR family transcriptional regulator [Caulobacter ginsengisoli]MDQ0462922.1 PadR family transcriptional regulator PadR [Caulobacter ginsengisoli]
MTDKTSPDAGLAAGPEGRKAQLLKGLAELALLSLLKDRAHYGLEILDRLRAEAGLDLAEGTIYPLLHRLERGGLVAAEWRMESEGARPRKYYQLTDAGRAELVSQSAEWRRIATSLTAFLDRSGA